MLQGRHEDIVEKLAMLRSSDDTLIVAKELYVTGHVAQAFKVASYGLTIEGRQYQLGEWLGQAAESHGNNLLAYQAFLVAFNDTVRLEGYKALIRVTEASDQERVKKELMELLRSRPREADAVVKIFLYEKLLEDAIGIIESPDSFASVGTIREVMSAVMSYKPEWVIAKVYHRVSRILSSKAYSEYGVLLTG